MKPLTALSLTAMCCLGLCLTGCQTPSPPLGIVGTGQHNTDDTDGPGTQVTVVIALSSIVPGGIVGHAGIAVEQDYWDYGPTRSKLTQPIKSIRSKAGPWWDDPDQQWAVDRTLQEVLCDMPDKVHPMGSLVAVVRVRVTDEQAEAITAFWQDTYERMRDGDDTYRLTARQCSSMVGWSLRAGMNHRDEQTDRLPRDMRRMTPTRLYEMIRDELKHTAGPSKGQPADITLWQLGRDGLTAWDRPAACDRLALPELPRIRLAVERVKHLPQELLSSKRFN